MSLIDAIRHRLYVLRRGDAYPDEVRRELGFHRELDTLARSGNSLGNETYYREEVRHMTLASWYDRVRQDVSYTWRGLKRAPVFTATFIMTLVLGLGINAAMYSLLDQLFTRPPAGVVGPEQVERLYYRLPSAPAVTLSFNFTEFDAIRGAARRPALVAAFFPSDPSMLVDGAIADSARTIQATPSYFAVLGLRPTIGRFFSNEESGASAAAVAVISERLWRRLYDASPAVLGRSVEVADRRVTIIGVAPSEFTGVDLNAGDVWVPFNVLPDPRNDRPWYQAFGLRVIARIDGQSERAQLIDAGAVALCAVMRRNNPRDTAVTMLTGPINEAAGPADRARETALAQRLAGAALLVLLIACANLANLLLVRATQRQREFAVRRALGVSRLRLVQQMLTESAVLCLIGVMAALLFATWVATALRHLLFPSTHWASSAVDTRAIFLTLGAGVAVAIVIGLVPAIDASNPDLVLSLKAARSSGSKPSRSQNVLLALQAAVAVLLLVGAGLIVRSFENIRSIDLGYETEDMIVASVPRTMPPDTLAARAFLQQLPDVLERLRHRPDVRAASLVNTFPMGGYAVIATYLPGRERRIPAAVFIVTGDHFAAAGVRIIAGRSLSVADVAGGERVTVVSERMAKEFWPNDSPIGKCIIVRTPSAGCTRVVGIARDTHRMNILEDGIAQYYLPSTQTDLFRPSSVVVRVEHGRAPVVAAAIRSELKQILPAKASANLRTMAQVLAPELRPWKMGAILFVALGMLALVVACVGIYGVVAYSMATRTHEMGIRIALGARMKDVINLVLHDGLRAVAIGIVIGIAAALAVGRLIRSLLFGVVANDPSTMIGAVSILIGCAALACLVPALRAGRIDPASALRAD